MSPAAPTPGDFLCLRTHLSDKTVESRLERTRVDDLTAGEVLVRTHFAGVNYKDCLSILGRARIIEGFPRIAGIELVGEVVHSAVTEFVAGQIVMAHGFRTGIAFDGGFAQFARVPAAHLMAVPSGLDAWQAATLGVPGFTAGIALDRFIELGLTPERGLVAVSGASGAVGMLAIHILARAGWRVAALTRKMALEPVLRALGAEEVIDTQAATAPLRPLEKARFSAAIDNVGGDMLGWLLRSLQDGGQIAVVGNAGGNDFPGNVLPFVMRSIGMFGVVGNASWPVRQRVWGRLAGDWRPDFLALAAHVQTIGLSALPDHASAQLAGTTCGRTLVDLR
ncbi:MAG: YhdH/YhfP family quinone oxidoreductase [Rhodoferax sp.]|jgi:acrylyl-CoA reductase (NADPH)|nr:YhdH/YhfP family quinone oxidoreductase [Rhodoferax sp.]